MNLAAQIRVMQGSGDLDDPVIPEWQPGPDFRHFCHVVVEKTFPIDSCEEGNIYRISSQIWKKSEQIIGLTSPLYNGHKSVTSVLIRVV